MVPAEVLKRVRQIDIQTRKWVNNVFSGEFASMFKGQGMEFNEVREYQFGDDIRAIDWNVTARMNNPFVKKFQEERELTVMLLCDMSLSGTFGTRNKLKIDMAVEIAALLAFSAIKNNDRVGLVIFTDRIEKYIPPRKGRRHVLRLIRDLLTFKPENIKTDIAGVLQYLNKVLKRRAIVFMISDMMAGGYEKALAVANRKYDLIAVTINDPAESSLPGMGFVRFEDAESGQEVLVDTSDRAFRDRFKRKNAEVLKDRNRLFHSMNMDHVDLTTSEDYILPLIRFFRRRMKERR